MSLLNDIKEEINLQILPRIIEDLDEEEKVSIIFLMQVIRQSIIDVTEFFTFNDYGTLLKQFIIENEGNWEERFIESLYIIKNKQIIKNLGIEHKHLEEILSNDTSPQYIHPMMKCFYKLCEQLNDNETNTLIQSIGNEITHHPALKDIKYLEIYILYWIKERYISMEQDNTWYIDKLIKNLKKLNKDSICEELIESARKKESFNNEIPQNSQNNHVSQGIRDIKTGLLIIVNEIHFMDKYETRIGSQADENRLTETFKNFGFEVHIERDLTEASLLKLMRNIPQSFGNSWDCLFFCLLTHGCEGKIITCDTKEVSLNVIDNSICQPALKNVMKVVLIQACQGQKKGVRVVNNLTTDGLPSTEGGVSELSRCVDFCIFMSTMQGFISIRHKEEGSWFINTVCDVLQNKENISFFEFVREVTRIVKDLYGKVDQTLYVNQLPELLHSRFIRDFKFPLFQNKDRAPS